MPEKREWNFSGAVNRDKLKLVEECYILQLGSVKVYFSAEQASLLDDIDSSFSIDISAVITESDGWKEAEYRGEIDFGPSEERKTLSIQTKNRTGRDGKPEVSGTIVKYIE